jgi:N6-L-threonylcarbamoyladenine synthase
LYRACLADAGAKPADVDVVAVARGPGLLGSLLTGVSFAKGLALGMGARLVGVDHLHAHVLAAGLETAIPFPAVALLISGGHTNLYMPRSELELELLGRTLDDAAGEAFDKAAKVLNLPYPGGAVMDRLAAFGVVDKTMFPRPYLDNQNLDFSFSGLKTAFAHYIAGRRGIVPERLAEGSRLGSEEGARKLLGPHFQEIADICASYGWSIAETLRIKAARALDRLGDEPRAVVLAGGVACNSTVRKLVREEAAARGLAFVAPSNVLCTDNAAMIAYTGCRLAEAGLCHDLALEAVPRGSKVPRDYTACR